MRFVLVTETFPPEINGVAMSLRRILGQMQALGHDVRVVRPRQPEDRLGTGVLEFNDVLVPGIPLWGYKGLRMGLPWYARVRKAIEEFEADAVYVATEGPLGLAAIWASRRLKRLVVTGYHTNFQQYMRHYRLGFLSGAMNAFMRRVHNATAGTFAPSDALVEELTSLGYRNCRVLGRGVDVDLFRPERRSEELRANWGVKGEMVVCFYVGRIAGEKNLDLFFRGAAKLSEEAPGLVKAVVVGDGPELGRLQKAHPEAVFTGTKRDVELANHVASGDIFLFPSRTETFGNVITEAMASGLVVASYDYAAARRFIRDGANGFVAPLDDEGALVEAALRAFRSRERWIEIRAKARETVLEVSWRSVVQQFVAVLEEMRAPLNNQDSVNG
ncbi:MAG: glycosyltransferase family 4 protein [Puniceicoccaceae bacterium]